MDVIQRRNDENSRDYSMAQRRDKICFETRTDLQNFYSGQNLFITGATGFMGKILIEKLLRSCPDIENIYILCRSKKGKDVHTRIEEMFDDPVSPDRNCLICRTNQPLNCAGIPAIEDRSAKVSAQDRGNDRRLCNAWTRPNTHRPSDFDQQCVDRLPRCRHCPFR